MKRKKIFVAIGILGTILLIGSLFLLKVRSVSCSTTTNVPCPSVIETDLLRLEGMPLLRYAPSLKQIVTRSEVKKYTTRISPLGSLAVTLTLRDPVIAFKASGAEVSTLYTEDGTVVGESTATDLPTIAIVEQVEKENIPFLAQFGYELSRTFSVNTFIVTGTALEVNLSDGRKLFYPLSGDIDVLLGASLLTFSQLNRDEGKLMINGEPTAVKEIDFRFKNPVLR